jgi:YD repeat-containing protein
MGPKQTRSFVYDGYGRLTSQTTPEAGTISYQYKPDDQISRVTDARSIYADFDYNNRNLLTNINYSDSTPDVTYSYGEYGERTLMQETGGGQTSYSYDAYKRLQTETRTFQGLSGTYSVGYQYNYVDAIKKVTTVVNSWTREVNYGYTYAGAPSTVGTNLVTISGLTSSNNIAKDLTYRAFGALKQSNFGNGRRMEATYLDTRHFLNTLVVKKQDGSDSIVSQTYDYKLGSDAFNGRVRKITDSVDGDYTTTYGYDDYNRLTSASATVYGRTYTYDAWGNFRGATVSGLNETSGSYTLGYVQISPSAESKPVRLCR